MKLGFERRKMGLGEVKLEFGSEIAVWRVKVGFDGSN